MAPALHGFGVGAAVADEVLAVVVEADRAPHYRAPGRNCAGFLRSCAVTADAGVRGWWTTLALTAPSGLRFRTLRRGSGSVEQGQ